MQMNWNNQQTVTETQQVPAPAGSETLRYGQKKGGLGLR